MSAWPTPLRVLAVPVGVVVVALALVGALTLQGWGVAGVLLAAGLAAVLGAGLAPETTGPDGRRAAVTAARRWAGSTAGSLLVLAGTAAVGGATLAVLTAVVAALGASVVGAVRSRRAPAAPAAPSTAAPLLTPVADLSTEALGREWVRSAGALDAELEPGTRQHVVRRRQDTLDELERRDPEGFARWLAGGARVDTDPATWVRGDPAP